MGLSCQEGFQGATVALTSRILFDLIASRSRHLGAEATKRLVHFALIYQGDVARYRASLLSSPTASVTHVRTQAARRLFAALSLQMVSSCSSSLIFLHLALKRYNEARERYEQALLLLPLHGNAFSQLAILSTYEEDTLGAGTYCSDSAVGSHVRLLLIYSPSSVSPLLYFQSVLLRTCMPC